MFTFTTGGVAPTQLVLDWDGLQNINGNQDAVFAGFALNAATPIPEPSSALLALLATLTLLRRQRRSI